MLDLTSLLKAGDDSNKAPLYTFRGSWTALGGEATHPRPHYMFDLTSLLEAGDDVSYKAPLNTVRFHHYVRLL